MRLSDYVIDYLAQKGIKHIFMVSGGGGMFLIDSLGLRKDIEYVCNHHEQASVMSAEGYQRVTGNIGAVLLTTGPAGTNGITGILCAWNDSIPLIVVSGQANSKRLIGKTGLRQKGVHEANITEIVKNVTKYAVTVMDKDSIRYHMEKAVYLAKNGRPGPVWIDIPLDIQSSDINPKKLKGFNPNKLVSKNLKPNKNKMNKLKKIIEKSERPIILAGHGIILSGAQKEFINLISKNNIPVVTTKNAFDLVEDLNPKLAGRVGINGQRAGNFAIQNSDLIISIGSRLSYPTIGYETDLFARYAFKVVVDIDSLQLEKANIDIDMSINCDAKEFIVSLSRILGNIGIGNKDWLKKCIFWRKKYPTITEKLLMQKKYVNSYVFFDRISDFLNNSDIMIMDQGAAFYSYTVAFKNKRGQHIFTNGGFSPMGYGLPAAIGACFANNKKRVICVHGDGGLEMNIQELQTVLHYKLPIKLFVFNNQGYASIKHTQNYYFSGRFVGCDPKSGVSCVNMKKLSETYKMAYLKIENHSQLNDVFLKSLSIKGPVLIEVMLDPIQEIAPKVASFKNKEGKLVSKPLEDMYPFLPREEFYKEMIVEPVKEIN